MRIFNDLSKTKSTYMALLTDQACAEYLDEYIRLTAFYTNRTAHLRPATLKHIDTLDIYLQKNKNNVLAWLKELNLTDNDITDCSKLGMLLLEYRSIHDKQFSEN